MRQNKIGLNAVFIILVLSTQSYLYSAPRGTNALESLSKRIAGDIAALLPSGSSIAIEAFDDATKTELGAQLASIAQRVIRQSILEESSLLLVESQNIDAILKNMELQLSGLMESGKAPAIGMLIGAKYLAFGEITSEPDGYRFQLRLVELETGRIVYEEGATFALSGAKELVQIYAPPGYRLTLGILLQDLDFSPAFAVGLDLGFGWFLTAQDELLFGASASYGALNPVKLADDSLPQPGGDYYDRQSGYFSAYSFDGRIGYGRCFKPTPFVLLRPQISVGALFNRGFVHSYVTHLDESGTVITGEEIEETVWSNHFVPYLDAGFAIVLSNDSPLGYYFELGCERFLPSLAIAQDSPFGLPAFSGSIEWRARFSTGIQFHL